MAFLSLTTNQYFTIINYNSTKYKERMTNQIQLQTVKKSLRDAKNYHEKRAKKSKKIFGIFKKVVYYEAKK